jgi:hypothetical protein
MPDELRSPIRHQLVIHRIDLERGIRRFYSLMIERDLFGTVRLVRNWGRIGTNGVEALARLKRRRRLVIGRAVVRRTTSAALRYDILFSAIMGKGPYSGMIHYHRIPDCR